MYCVETVLVILLLLVLPCLFSVMCGDSGLLSVSLGPKEGGLSHGIEPGLSSAAPVPSDLWIPTWHYPHSAVGRVLPFQADFNSPSKAEVGGVAATIPVGSGPTGVAYDSGNGNIYVASFLSRSVSVISTATNAVVASVPVGNASDITYDSGNGNLYVSNYWSRNISVISGATNKVTGSIFVGGYPYGVRYDSGSGNLYVENWIDTLLVVSDKNNSIIANVTVGTGPSAAAYDSANNCVYVDNDFSDNVSVISGSTNKVVATIPVGKGPMDIRFDSGNGEIYTPDWFSDNVTVISGATNKVVANIPVGLQPNGAGYDPGNGDVYVGNWNSSNVSVISGATNTVIGSLTVGTYPYYMAYASSNGGMYVANDGGNSVSEISTLLGLGSPSPYYRAVASDGNVTTATLQVGTDPASIGYDQGNGDYYVANAGSSNVSVISGTTGRIVATIPVGIYPFGVAYDSSNSDVYVTDAASNAVSLISGFTDKVVATVQVPSSPLGIAYDSGDGNLYVSSFGGHTLNVISGSTLVRNVTVGTSPTGVAYDSSNGCIYVANSATDNVSVVSDARATVVTTIPVGNDPSGVTFDSWNGDLYVSNYISNNMTVISGTTNQVVGSIKVGTEPFDSAFDSENGNTYVANSGQDTVSVISGSTDTVVNTLDVGKGPDGIAFDADQGSLYVANANSNSTSMISTLVQANLTAIASADVGQTLSISVPILGQGSGEDSFDVSESPSSGLACHSDIPRYASVFASCVATGSGRYNVTFTVQDEGGYSVWSSVQIIIGAIPSVLTPSASPRSVDVGQNVTFTSATPTWGVGPYNYSWSGLPTGCSILATPTGNCTPWSPGTFRVTVTVRDSNGYWATSSALPFTVYGNPSVSVPVPSLPSGIVGQSVIFSTIGSGGSGGLTYRWTFSSSHLGCNTSINDTISCTPTVAGAFVVNVTATDSNGGTGSATSEPFQVDPAALSITISSFVVSPAKVVMGKSITLTVTANGGTGALTYAYAGLPAGCNSQNSPTFSCIPSAAGNFTVRVYVNDSAGHGATAATSLSVSRSSNPGSAPFLSGTTLLVVVLVVVVVAAIGVAVLVVVMKPRLAGLEKSEEKDAEQRPKDAWSSSQQSPKPTAKDSTHK
jgi:YVTN family beta-propeller protein